MTTDTSPSGTRPNPPVPAKVYVFNLDRLLDTSLRRSLGREPGIRIVGSAAAESTEKGDPRLNESNPPGYWDTLVADIEDSGAETVIFGRHDERRAGELSALLRTRVLVLTSRGETLQCSEYSPQSDEPQPVSHDELVRRIRESAQAARTAESESS